MTNYSESKKLSKFSSVYENLYSNILFLFSNFYSGGDNH